MKMRLLLGVFCLLTMGTAVAHERESVMVVGVGGYKSCRNGLKTQFIANSFYQMIKDVRKVNQGIDVYYMLVCADGLAAVRGDMQKLEYIGPRGCGWTSPNGLAQTIRNQMPSPSTKIIGIGHSHGGDYISHVAESLKMERLFLIEPISACQCTTKDWLKNRPKKVFKRRQRIVAGCRQAPTDWDFNKILLNTNGQVYNFHLNQTQDRGFLYSSPVANAINVEKTLLKAEKSHHLLGLDYNVWSDICQNIQTALGAKRDVISCKKVIVDWDGRLQGYAN